jgi:hypothetical protein
MRSLIVVLLGLVVGATTAVAFIYYNPFAPRISLSPISVSDRPQIILNYSAVAANSIIFTNDGNSRVHPFPAKVQQLWEAPIRDTETMVTLLRDGRDDLAGFGIKFSSKSERTNLRNGEALIDSAWYVYLPGQGTMLVAQSENHWAFMREIVVPAHWSSGDSWRGNWYGTITDGPSALGTGRVYGSSGQYSGLEFEVIETRSAKAYSAEEGPVAMDGQLIIELVAEDENPELEAAAL